MVALHKERTYERETAKGRLQIQRLISHKPTYIMSILMSLRIEFVFLSCTPIVYLIMHLTCGIKISNGSLSQNILQGLCMELTDYETQVLCDKFDPGKEGR